ncbi:hypothetical protein BKA70DRAFT_1374288 [Coprinopsis sp. MPI-PUGE-AT-0042]|nr:hypothetical protein BKA70DRAFT_1374288 [Coprinopsis sp. MPI-PUGE-AT-0042]
MTSVEDPFQLSSYTSSSRWKGKKSSLDHVYITQLNSSLSKSRKEGYVTVATQADGVHLVDISTLHPLVSHTLGPSTSFSCPAITLETAADHYATYAVINSSPDLASADEAGRVVWKWDQKPGSVSSMTESQKRPSKAIISPPHRIHSLHSDPSLSNRILAFSTSGEIIVLDSDTLEQKASTSASSEPISGVKRAFVFSSTKSSFATPSASGTTIVIAYITSLGLLQVTVVSLDNNDSFSDARTYQLPHNTEQITGVSCSESGCFSVLCTSNVHPAIPPSNTSNSSRRKLARLHPLSRRVRRFPNHRNIWDLQYSVLLSSHSLTVPSAFANAPVQIRLGSRGPDIPSSSAPSSLVHGQAVMILSPAAGGKQEQTTTSMSSVMIVPYSVPVQSTIAAALGRGNAEDAAASEQETSPAEAARVKVLGGVRTSLEAGRMGVAETAFSTWLSEAETAAKEAEKEKVETAPIFTHNFVKDLVNALLPPLKANGKAPYAHSSEILKALMERRLVFNGMVEGGILAALRARNDWTTIQQCFSLVNDLPINDIVESLVAVIRHHRSPSDAMVIDSSSSSSTNSAPPSIPIFLSLVINYPTPTTPSQTILALKRHLRDPEDVSSVAQTLVSWIRTLNLQKKNTELGIWPSNKDMEVNEHGVPVYNLKNREKRNVKSAAKKVGGPPVFEKIISFLQPFLDATFLPLLSHTPSHALLAELQTYLTEESTLSDLLIQLQGALEPFSVHHQKVLREASIPEKEREKRRQRGDWRQRRGGVAGVVGEVGAVGVYQLEELVFSVLCVFVE